MASPRLPLHTDLFGICGGSDHDPRGLQGYGAGCLAASPLSALLPWRVGSGSSPENRTENRKMITLR